MSVPSIRAHLLLELAKEAPRSHAEAAVRRANIGRLRRALAAAEAHGKAVAAWNRRGRPQLPALAAPWGRQ